MGTIVRELSTVSVIVGVSAFVESVRGGGNSS